MSASGPPIEEMTAGWRLARTSPSLPESFRSVAIPAGAPWWRKMLAFAGPGYLVAVGYMDPGNWATDLAGGSRFGYTLLSVILLSNLMAILLQALALRLGIVTGRDLAQACRDHYSRPVSFVLWVLCEIAIAACDLAEVIGSAIALNLLFGIPLALGRLHHRRRRPADPAAPAPRLPLARGVRHRARRHHRRLLRHRAAAGAAGHRRGRARPGAHAGDRLRSRQALHRHRHPRRHRHAAQPLPAQLHRADPELRATPTRASARPSSTPPSTPRSRSSSPSSSTPPS